MSAMWEAMPALAATLVFQLLRAALVGGLFVGLAWLICRWTPRLSPASRAWIWWLAGAKFLLVLLAVPSIPVPVLPNQFAQTLGATPLAEVLKPISSPALTLESFRATPVRSDANPLVPGSVGAATEQRRPGRFREAAPVGLVLLWVTGLVLGSISLAQEIARGRRLERTALRVEDGSLRELFEELRERYRVGRVRLGLLPGSGSPQVRGLSKPIVLIPEETLRALSRGELEWVIRHELMHVRRRDLWLGLVPLLSARLFFFHPLALFARREYDTARESACDAAVLGDPDTSPRAYGELLLKLGAHACPPSAAAALVDRNSLKRRLEMLHNLSQRPRIRQSWPFIVLAVLALIPLRPIAAGATPETAAKEAPAAPADASPAAESEAQRKTPPTPPTPPTAPTAPTPPVPATAPAAPAPVTVVQGAPLAEAGGSGQASDLSYVLLKGDHTESSTAWIGGSSRDLAAARALRQGSEALFYVRTSGGAWVIRDPELLRQIDAVFQPQRELGAKQADIGRQQAEFGRQQAEVGRSQAEFGAQQAELGRRQAEFGRQQAELAREQARLSVELARIELERALVAEGEQEGGPETSADSRAELREKLKALAKRQSEFAAQQRALGDRQREFGEQQRAVGDQQSPLAAKQRPLAAQQHALAEQQRVAARVARGKLRTIVDRAIADGKASPVKH